MKYSKPDTSFSCLTLRNSFFPDGNVDITGLRRNNSMRLPQPLSEWLNKKMYV